LQQPAQSKGTSSGGALKWPTAHCDLSSIILNVHRLERRPPRHRWRNADCACAFRGRLSGVPLRSRRPATSGLDPG
jgi:hypothetical protein